MSIRAQERRLREYADRKRLEVEEIFAITESSTKDTRIDETMYLEKVREYKSRQAEILEEMKHIRWLIKIFM